MARSANQKLKLLYLMKMLLEKSDEKHALSIREMIDGLAAHDISAERKSIYGDLEALRTFGLDIVQSKGKTTGYYVASRDFELPELKLLVDSVQSSKFITHRKTLALIKKIEGLASVYDARLLQRQVYVRNRVKSMNESVYYNVDEISNAITGDRMIRFKYFELDINKQRRYRHNGKAYEISPFALMWDDENYYMLGFDAAAKKMKHYRVDKMIGIESGDGERRGKEIFSGMDMSAYSKQVFGMFTGSEQAVKLRFEKHLVGAVIDRFGKDTMLIPDGEEHFTVTVSVVVSPQFYAWLFGFGPEAEIMSPESVRREMADRASDVADMYNARSV